MSAEVAHGLLGHARARSWPAVAAGAAVLAVLGVLGQHQSVLLPMVERTVDLRTVYVVVGTVFVTVPLLVTFPELVRTLPRERVLRVVRPVGVVGLLALAIGPSLVGVPDAWTHPDVLLAMLLLSVGLVATSLLGSRAWVVSFAVGLLLLLVDGSHAQPVTRLLQEVGVVPLLALLVAGVAACAWLPGTAARGTSPHDGQD